MIDRLRRKFIRICMLSFAAVFLILFAAIYLATEVQTSARLDTLADLVSENDGIFPDFEQFGREEGQILPPDGVNQESPFTTRFFTVRFDGDGALLSVDVRAIASVSTLTRSPSTFSSASAKAVIVAPVVNTSSIIKT